MKLFNDRTCIALGALNALLAVAMGAFGAHGLKSRVGEDMLAVFATGAEYHMSHALALVLLGLVMGQRGERGPLRWSGALFLLGILLFSGSLYLLAITGIRGLGMVTPFGGTAFLVAWGLMAWGAWRGKTL